MKTTPISYQQMAEVLSDMIRLSAISRSPDSLTAEKTKLIFFEITSLAKDGKMLLEKKSQFIQDTSVLKTRVNLMSAIRQVESTFVINTANGRKFYFQELHILQKDLQENKFSPEETQEIVLQMSSCLFKLSSGKLILN